MPKESLVYNKKLLDNYQNPRNFGKLNKPTHRSEQPNPACGDEVIMYLNVKGNKIEEIKYEARGCALMIVSASVLSEYLTGKNTKTVDKIGRSHVEKLLSTAIPKTRDKCILLPIKAIKRALNN